MKLLNIAAGKMPYLEDTVKNNDSLFIVNLDTMYYNYDAPELIEAYYHGLDGNTSPESKKIFYCKEDVVSFLERTQMTFDVVTIYRFLEHVSFTQVLYFIYLVSGVVRKGGIVDVIVPNYRILAQMIIEESMNNEYFEHDNILLTTELLNEPSCPHASIWTPARAVHFWEFEKRFIVHNGKLSSQFVYDGRDVYLRFQAERI
jgi:hypothetical protein